MMKRENAWFSALCGEPVTNGEVLCTLVGVLAILLCCGLEGCLW